MASFPRLPLCPSGQRQRLRVLVLFGSAEEEARVGDWLEQQVLGSGFMIEQDLGLLRSDSDLNRLRYQVAQAGDSSRRILFLRNAQTASRRSMGRLRHAFERGSLRSNLEMITMITVKTARNPAERLEAEFAPDVVVRIDPELDSLS